MSSTNTNKEASASKDGDATTTAVAKSCVTLDVKPWDEETDLVEVEKCIRSIEMEGLVWGQFQLAPVAYGVKKLVATCVIEDDKVNTSDLEERIQEFDDYVQSVDIVSFNKLDLKFGEFD